MVHSSRREFLKHGVYALLATQLFGCGSVLLDNRSRRKGKAVLPSFNAGKLRVFDWDKRSFSEFDIPLRSTHSALRSGVDSSEILVFDNVGPGCVAFDLEAGVIRQVVTPNTGRYFYGHGAVTADGKYLIHTEYPEHQENYSRGTLSVRRLDTLAHVHELDSHGIYPHDVCFVDANTIAVTNHGTVKGKSVANLSFISLRDGSLLQQVEKDSQYGHFGHLIPYNSDSVFVSSTMGAPPENAETKALTLLAAKGGTEGTKAAIRLQELTQYKPSPMYVIGRDGSKRAYWSENNKDSFKNNFSICRISPEKNLFVSANGASDAVVIWDENTVRKILKFPGMYPSAVAVSADGMELIVGGSNGTVKFLSTEDFTEIPGTATKLQNGPVHILSIS